MAKNQDYTNLIVAAMVPAYVLLLLNMYYYSFPFFYERNLTFSGLTDFMLKLRKAGFFTTYIKTKLYCILISIMACLMRVGSKTKVTKMQSLIIFGAGIVFFVIPPIKAWPLFYVITSTVGFIAAILGASLFSRNLGRKLSTSDARDESWKQCEDLIENEDSVNLRMRYCYQGKWRKGWINFPAPQRSVTLWGIPGSGKTFAVINQFITQMLQKRYTMFVYDYKFPDLTNWTYNELLRNINRYKVTPKFCVINFKDVRYSHRCNPINPKYITQKSDSTEIADILWKNVKTGDKKDGDFFSMSAKEYVDALIYYLRIYENGKYCTFPHVIELMGQPYEEVFEILMNTPELETKIVPFVDALKTKVFQQLQGQIASARIPLNKFNDAYLYWVLSGDDFTLDINNPEEPKILCVGNDPDRQETYSTTIALFTSRLFKCINHPGRDHSAAILDEMPTTYLKGLDQLIATARSNGVAIIMGSQDKAQIIRDYDKKEADVITGIAGNLIAGQVKGDTAKALSQAFGTMKVEKQSVTYSDNNDSVNVSEQKEELMPVSRIENLSQGYFFGTVADLNEQKIEEKRFFGEVIVDVEEYARKKKTNKKLPQLTFFDEENIRNTIWGIQTNPEESEEDKQIRLKKAEDHQRNLLTVHFREQKNNEYNRQVEEFKQQIIEIQTSFGENHAEEKIKILNQNIENIRIHQSKIHNEVIEEISKLSQDEMIRIIDEETEKLCDKVREDKIMANYNRIRNEIKTLVSTEYQKIIEKQNSEQQQKQNEQTRKNNQENYQKLKDIANQTAQTNQAKKQGDIEKLGDLFTVKNKPENN